MKGGDNMRLVNADDAEKYFYEHLDDLHMLAAMNAINEMPTIDAEPVKYGKWTYDNSYALHCSYCGREAYYSEWGAEKFPFCPYCGAEMYEN